MIADLSSNLAPGRLYAAFGAVVIGTLQKQRPLSSSNVRPPLFHFGVWPLVPFNSMFFFSPSKRKPGPLTRRSEKQVLFSDRLAQPAGRFTRPAVEGQHLVAGDVFHSVNFSCIGDRPIYLPIRRAHWKVNQSSFPDFRSSPLYPSHRACIVLIIVSLYLYHQSHRNYLHHT